MLQHGTICHGMVFSSGRIFILVSARYNHNAELVFCRDTFIFKQMYLSIFDY